MPQVGQTYTPDNAYEERVKQLRSQVGDNPEAIRQAVTSEKLSSDQPLQESIQGQQGSIDALGQLAEYDKQLADQVRGANTQQMQTTAARNTATTAMGAVDPSSAAATIAQGPAQLDVKQFSQQYAPTTGILSPFVASGLTSGQSQAATDTYSLASQLRGSRERIIGSEAAAYADVARAQIERDRIEEEKRRLEEERIRQDKERQFEIDLKYAQTYGGNIVDPISGKEYRFEKPKTEEEKKAEAEQSVFNKIGTSGKRLIEDVTDDQGSFIDIIRQNPTLSEDEKLALARANVNKYGGFKESPQELVDMGLGWILQDPLLLKDAQSAAAFAVGQKTGNVNADVTGLVEMVRNGSMKLENVPSELRTQVANEMAKKGPQQTEDPATLAANKEVADLAKEILASGGTKGLTGNVRLGLLNPFSQDLKTKKAKIEQLKSKLSIAMAQKMKGQGTLSDAERAMIANAASSLDYKMEDDAFRAELQRIADEYGATSSPAQSGTLNTTDNSDPLGIL